MGIRRVKMFFRLLCVGLFSSAFAQLLFVCGKIVLAGIVAIAAVCFYVAIIAFGLVIIIQVLYHFIKDGSDGLIKYWRT